MEQQIRGRTPKRLLDIGCGGGHVAYRMAPHAAEVIASDLSSEMIAAVVREAAQRDIGNIATVKAAAESLPFASGHFDAVVGRFSAHHWGDLTGGLREDARVLQAGGQALFVDGRRSEEQTSELQSLMRISYDFFSWKKKKTNKN